MKNVKTPTSDSYHDYLISSLKDPEEAAAYIEAILEEKDPEPELIIKALSNVAEAIAGAKISSEQAHLHKQQLNKILSKEGSKVIYNLVDWLSSLGLKLTVTVNKEVLEVNTVGAVLTPLQTSVEPQAQPSKSSEVSCPKCQSTEVCRKGRYKDKQRYVCKECGRQFMLPEPHLNHEQKITDNSTALNDSDNTPMLQNHRPAI